MLRLSKRLEHIANNVPYGSRLADIGSDHALLPAYLAQQGRIVKGVAGEVNPGPFKAASKQIAESRLETIIDVRLGNGLEVIAAEEVDVITIAGMGGALIADILESGKEKLEGVSLLVLQPNVGEYNVRSWLLANDWVLNGEQILEEDGKIYEILIAQPGKSGKSNNEQLYHDRFLTEGLKLDREFLLTMGPYLLDNPSPVWFEKWRLELDKLEMIRTRLGESALPESRRKEQELTQEMNRIREVMTWLQKDKV
jgi:tRNA (adenine22-N1)-methyltransferase